MLYSSLTRPHAKVSNYNTIFHHCNDVAVTKPTTLSGELRCILLFGVLCW